jgi:hypothetical protein
MHFLKYRNIFFTLMLVLTSIIARPQQSNTLYFMKDIYQSGHINPAFSPSENYIVGLPFISGVNVGFANDFKLKNAIEKGHGLFSDTLRFNFNTLTTVLSENNRANMEADVSMFFIGIKDRKNFYSVSVNEKEFLRLGMDKGFAEYFKNGIKYYYGKDADLGGLTFHTTQYREVGLGISRQANKKLTYGARLKFLFGKLNMESVNLDFQTKTVTGAEVMYIHPSGIVKISGPVKFETDTIEKTTRLRNDLQATDYFFNFKNLGLAADFGFDFKANKQMELSASLIDLGFLRFSKKNYNMSLVYDQKFKKNDLTQASDPTAPNYLSGTSAFYAFRDSIPYMSSATKTSKNQWVTLPVKFYTSISYKANKNLTLGFLEKLYFHKNFFYNATTISAQAELSGKFTLTGSWSIIKSNFFNPGIGMVYRTGILQVYFISDNIYSVISPSDVKNLNLQLGINLLIGKG